MAIKLDESDASGVLVTCTDCPYWFAFAWSTEGGYKSGAGHLERTHGIDKSKSGNALRQWRYRQRHAAGETA